MTSSIGGFVSTWSPSFYSTTSRVELRNVRQGGNNFLAAQPLTGQAMWGGTLLATVATVVQGPLKWVVLFFRTLFHPLVSFPLSIISCAVKEGMYESSVAVPVLEQTKHFALGAEVPVATLGTVTLMVDNQPRHFAMGGDITYWIENSLMLEEGGQTKRFYCTQLGPEEPFGADCRVIERNGERIRYKVKWELGAEYESHFEIEVDGRKRYVAFENEVAAPVPGTVSIANPLRPWQMDHYQIGGELPAAEPHSASIKIKSGNLHYNTGRELVAPTPQSRSFTIDGKLRHFASAKFIPAPAFGLSGWFNKIRRNPLKLPTRLSRTAIRALELTNAHMSAVIRVAILVASAALVYFGFYAMAAGAFLAIAYEYLNHDLGIIPHKVSLFMERWMPMISMVGLLIVGSWTAQILAGVTLLLMLPAVNLWLQQKISKITRTILMGLKEQLTRWLTRGRDNAHFDEMVRNVENYPTLEESDAPLVENRVMNRAQIDHILNANNDRYELAPAHLTKNFEPALNLPQNRNFTELKRLWEAEGTLWVQPNTYTRVVGRLADDKRFFLFLQKRFPEAKLFHFTPNWRLTNEQNRTQWENLRRAHRNQVESWIQTLTQEKGFNTKEAFIASWLKEQLEFYVGKLSGTRPIEGEQRLLEDAIQNTAKILPFLLNPATSRVEREDALIKLAIEGGDYCSLAMKRASREVLDGFAEPLYLQAEPNPHKAFELETRLALQQMRHQMIQTFYKQGIVQLFSQNEETRETGEDIHLYTALMRAFKRGIYPLESEDIRELGLVELLMKETIMLPMQAQMLQRYQEGIPNTMAALGIDRRNLMSNRILDYLRNWTEQSAALSAPEKQELLNGPLASTPDNLIDADNYPKWSRLMLYINGIIREKPNQ